MTYIEKHLIKDEKIIYTAKVSWLTQFRHFFNAGIFFILCLLSLYQAINFIYFNDSILVFGKVIKEVPSDPIQISTVFWVLAAIMGFFFLRALWRALIPVLTTEVAITNKRVITKFGFIARDISELTLHQVEAVYITQSIMGRLFGYGSIIVKGIGGGSAPMACITKPFVFKQTLYDLIPETKSQLKTE